MDVLTLSVLRWQRAGFEYRYLALKSFCSRWQHSGRAIMYAILHAAHACCQHCHDMPYCRDAACRYCHASLTGGPFILFSSASAPDEQASRGRTGRKLTGLKDELHGLRSRTPGGFLPAVTCFCKNNMLISCACTLCDCTGVSEARHRADPDPATCGNVWIRGCGWMDLSLHGLPHRHGEPRQCFSLVTSAIGHFYEFAARPFLPDCPPPNLQSQHSQSVPSITQRPWHSSGMQCGRSSSGSATLALGDSRSMHTTSA